MPSEQLKYSSSMHVNRFYSIILNRQTYFKLMECEDSNSQMIESNRTVPILHAYISLSISQNAPSWDKSTPQK